jgi:hypothetical protein
MFKLPNKCSICKKSVTFCGCQSKQRSIGNFYTKIKFPIFPVPQPPEVGDVTDVVQVQQQRSAAELTSSGSTGVRCGGPSVELNKITDHQISNYQFGHIPDMSSKVENFTKTYLTNGTSEMIERYKLPQTLGYYISGDGIFRSDASLGKIYKFCRFGKIFKLDRISQAWQNCITPEEEEILRKDHQHFYSLEESEKYFERKHPLWDKKYAIAVHFIKFYGAAPPIVNQGIRPDIRKIIINLPCCFCGTSNNIECDHKNDLWEVNDKRIGILSEQKLEDFQPLCKHCNCRKRSVKKKTLKEGKRQPSGFPNIPFTQGTSTFNKTDPYWYVGTQWGDVQAFKNDCFPRCCV